MRVVPLEAFRDKIPFAVAIAAVEQGFRALGRGEAALPDPMVLELREQQAEVHVKGAHLAGARHIVLKVATGFYRNRARGLPSGGGVFLLLGADTGAPAVLLEEHGYLTDFRTAAAVALTLKYLAPSDTHDALLVGAGALARLTARAMVAQLPLARLTVESHPRARGGTRQGARAGGREARSAGARDPAPRAPRERDPAGPRSAARAAAARRALCGIAPASAPRDSPGSSRRWSRRASRRRSSPQSATTA